MIAKLESECRHNSYTRELVHAIFIAYNLGQCTSLLSAKRKEFLYAVRFYRGRRNEAFSYT